MMHLNESVQENVTAIRVVKAYVRENYENKKFTKASDAIYKMFVKAEGIVALNAPVMMTTVYVCILLISWFGANMIVASGNNAALGLTTGNLTSLLAYCMNILNELNDAFNGICYDYNVNGKCKTYSRSIK